MTSPLTEDAPVSVEQPDSTGDSAQTVEAPIAVFGQTPPSEGDDVQFKVVSVDSQNGVVNLAYSAPEAGGKKPFGGSDEMAESMDEQPQMKGAKI